MSRIIDFNAATSFTAKLSNLTETGLSSADTGLEEIFESLDKLAENRLFLSIKQTSILFSVCIETIRKKVANGEIKSISFGKKKVISIAEIKRIIKNGGV